MPHQFGSWPSVLFGVSTCVDLLFVLLLPCETTSGPDLKAVDVDIASLSRIRARLNYLPEDTVILVPLTQ